MRCPTCGERPDLYAELRERAEEAEVHAKRLAEAMEGAEHHMTTGHGCVCGCHVIDGHTAECEVISALTAHRKDYPRAK